MNAHFQQTDKQLQNLIRLSHDNWMPDTQYIKDVIFILRLYIFQESKTTFST